MLRRSLILSSALLATAVIALEPSVTVAQSSPEPQVKAAPAATAPPTAQEPDGGAPTYVKAETPEERRLRVGNVDPGPNPDEHTLFYRSSQAFHITRFDRKWAVFDQSPGNVRPFAFTPFVYELYQMNEKYVWVWVSENPPPPVETSTPAGKAAAAGYTEAQLNYLRSFRSEFTKLDVPDSDKTIIFQESSEGLPTAGSWRNSLALADMNGDGHLDIVVPPQRGGDGLPSIFLGDGKGGWSQMHAVWPYRIDYGSVVAADFNKDGKMDLAFGVHLNGVRVFLGDGKGNFVDSSKGLPMTDFPTRRVVVADFDHDGYPDIAAISEGPGGGTSTSIAGGKVRIFLNRNKGKEWKAIDGADPSRVLAGDYLAVGNFNGDPYPDFVGASIFYTAYDLIYLSRGKLKWEPPFTEGDIIPFYSYYYAVAAGKFSSKKVDDAIMSYIRFWPHTATDAGLEPPQFNSIAGIDRISFKGEKATRTPIVRFPSSSQISGMAVGDFDGDGKLDLIFTRYEPREFVLLLGDGKGGFTRAHLEGLRAENNANYDIAVGDVNGDGKPDVVIMYEAKEATKLGPQGGSVRVFLNRGVAPRAKPAK